MIRRFGRQYSARRRIEPQFDLGENAAVRTGAGDEPAIDAANVRLMCVPADNHIYRAVEAPGNLADGWQILITGVTPDAWAGIHNAIPSALAPAWDQRDYMVRVDDQLMCKNMRCRKRFEIPSSQTVVFI